MQLEYGLCGSRKVCTVFDFSGRAQDWFERFERGLNSHKVRMAANDHNLHCYHNTE